MIKIWRPIFTVIYRILAMQSTEINVRWVATLFTRKFGLPDMRVLPALLPIYGTPSFKTRFLIRSTRLYLYNKFSNKKVFPPPMKTDSALSTAAAGSLVSWIP